MRVPTFARSLAVLAFCLALPATVFGQASITGTVRDTSGAVLPGVTVEASSPALIEKVRTVLSDGTGQYRIVDLRPGTYSVTFTLAGFAAVKREGIELTGAFVATVNADLRVGGVEESVTVTGETPIVDTQGTIQQKVMTRQIMDSVPASRFYGSYVSLIPGITTGTATAGIGIVDVGGSTGDLQANYTIHGSRSADQVISINGTAAEPSQAMLAPSTLTMDEVQVNTGGADASNSTGGIVINMVPRDGGNAFSGQFTGIGLGSGMVGNNLSDRLKAMGVTAVSPPTKIFDTGVGFGGPILHDRLWFYATAHYNISEGVIASLYRNKNAKNNNAWNYDPDLSRQVIYSSETKEVSGRLTWQMTPKNKFGVQYQKRRRCVCPDVDLASPALEAAPVQPTEPSDYYIADWSAPVTNRLLLSAGFVRLDQIWQWLPTEDYDPNLVAVNELTPPRIGGTAVNLYRARFLHQKNWEPYNRFQFTASYVTGAHALKVGMNQNWSTQAQANYALGFPYMYTFNAGVPTQLTLSAAPIRPESRTKADFGLYAQDKWTIQRLTVSGGLRFDYWNSYAPETYYGPGPLVPTRNITFPETPLIGWKDITPRMGAAYDLFGNGKTALKVTLNKYLTPGTTRSVVPGTPAQSLQTTAVRSWTDANNNYFPDCDILNSASQDNRPTGGDFCGPFTGNNLLFGKPILSLAFDPETRFGWGARPYSWEFSTSVQHQLTPRVGVDVGYFRRWYGNFTVTDNRALTPADYDDFSVTAPVDPALPDGGGYTVTQFINVTPAGAARTPDNIVRLADHYGNQIEHWNGVDASVRAQLGRGSFVQAGSNVGRTSTDNCAVLAQVPEAAIGAIPAPSAAPPALGPAGVGPYCRVDGNWLWQIKGMASYIVPKIEVQLSTTVQSIAGPQVLANYTVTNSQIQGSLGRPLSGNAQNITVNIIQPGSEYGDRLNQIDFRVGKPFRVGRSRVSVNLDFYNLTNSDAVLRENLGYGGASFWRAPSAVLTPRMMKVGGQIDF